jgi:hypothetical protein
MVVATVVATVVAAVVATVNLTDVLSSPSIDNLSSMVSKVALASVTPVASARDVTSVDSEAAETSVQQLVLTALLVSVTPVASAAKPNSEVNLASVVSEATVNLLSSVVIETLTVFVDSETDLASAASDLLSPEETSAAKLNSEVALISVVSALLKMDAIFVASGIFAMAQALISCALAGPAVTLMVSVVFDPAKTSVAFVV